MERLRLMFTGSGGQGVITASILLAEAAVMYEGLLATQSQSYGPEARGGATRSEVIISDSTIHFPKVNQPNVLICLTQESYMKFQGMVRPGGLLISDPKYVTVVRSVDARQIELPMYQAVMDACGNPLVYNVCVLGAVLGITKVVNVESVMKVLEKRLPPHLMDVNRTALTTGFALGLNVQGL